MKSIRFPRRLACLMAAAAMLAAATPASAQFTGPSARGAAMSVADASQARAGTYVTVEGMIASHLRSDYYLFRDASGEVRVEIDRAVFAARQVTPETRVRLLGEVDRNAAGVTYIWVKSLDVLN